MKTQAQPLPYLPQMIQDARLELGESREQFGRRFDVSRTTVWYWETGRYEAPYRVISWLLHQVQVSNG